MNQESIKKDLEGILSKSPWWSRFIGSQFVAYLVLFISQVILRITQATARSLQESFLSLATKRSSILAGAESRGYVGRKASPSTGPARVTNTSQYRLTLPALTQLVAANQMRYTLIESLDIQAGQSVDVTVSQFEIAHISHQVTNEKNWMSIALPRELTDRIHKAIVFVDGERWEKSFKFRYATSETKTYVEYYKATDQLGIRFGNNVSGKVPQIGSTITIELWLTEGESLLLDGQKLDIIESQDTGHVKGLSIVTTAQITGGDEAEDIESIRNGALYTTLNDDQIAWDSDYRGFIKNNISSIVWLSVWGEQEQEELTGKHDLDNINTIFFSAYSDKKTDSQLESEILKLFDGREGYNEKYRYSPRVDAPFTVTVTGFVFDSSNPKDVTLLVSQALEKEFGKKKKSTGTVFVKSVWSAVEKLGQELGIEEYSVECSGLLPKVPINTFQYLDIKESNIVFNYRKAQ